MTKLLKVALGLAAFLVVVFLGDIFFKNLYPFPQNVKVGVAFSQKYAKYLNEDWKKIYTRMLDDLKIKNLRLPTYWDSTEPFDGKYNFTDTDFMIDEARKRGAKIMLTLGERQFRYPECYIRGWARKLSLEQRRQKLLESITALVERYKTNDTISSWEVENEPLLASFGSGCDTTDRDFLKKEVELVRSLDKRPIVMTDSGELGLWVTSMRLSDIFGTTVYRKVYDKSIGFFNYPYLPYMYNLKSFLVRSIFARNNQKTILVELQAEPWFTDQRTASSDTKDQANWFSLKDFQDNMNFGRETGFDEVYLWGVEWWYFMADKGDNSYLNYAKTLFIR